MDLPHQYYILCSLSQPKRASTVRVKRPPSVRNERRTRRRIYDEEMGLREASASHVAKMIRLQKMVGKPQQVMGKMNRLQKMVGKFQQVVGKIHRV